MGDPDHLRRVMSHRAPPRRNDAVQCVMEHRTIAGNVLTRTNPTIFFQVHIDQHIVAQELPAVEYQ